MFSKADLAKDPADVEDFQHRQRISVTAVRAEEIAVDFHGRTGGVKPLVKPAEV